jgi:predicted nucleic acid-binding protein
LRAVTNSSILIALSTIGQLSLLHQRFPDGVFLPQAVWREVVETGKGQPGAQDVASASWLTIRQVTNTSIISLLRIELDEGEAEAIALVAENPVDAILLDEKNARRVARQMGLPVLGTVGILIWAKQQGLIITLKEQLDALQNQGKFRLSQSLYQEALNRVGE